MKTRMLLNKWVIAIILAMTSITNVLADTKVTSLDQLKAGTTIRIYPYGQGALPSMALACNVNDYSLISLSNAMYGEEWTLIDAGDGYFYLKNELGCYWAYQDNSTSHSLTCTIDISSAVAVSMTWDNKHNGVCFWNKTDGKGLNNLFGYNNRYNWYSSPSSYDSDTNTTFDVYVSDGEPSEYRLAEVGGLKLLLNLTKKTADVLPNDYKGDVVVPQSVNYEGTTYAITALDLNYFKNCTSIDARYCEVGDIGDMAFRYNSNLTSLSIGHVGVIGDNAFWCCSNLSFVSIDSVDSIGVWAFTSCSNLTTVSMRYVGSIGDRAFESCSNLTSVSIDSVGSIGGQAFGSCSNLTSVSIDSVGSIGDRAFEFCSNLTTVSMRYVGSIGGRAFESCSNLTSVSIDSVGSIGDRGFESCSNLSSVSIGHVGIIGERAFESCSNLTSVSIDSVDSIGDRAFNSDAETLITIKQIRHIGYYWFGGYRNNILKCYVENPEDIDAADDAHKGLKRLFVPKSSVEDYKNTKPWSNMADRIYPIADIPVTQIVLPETARIKKKGEEGKIQLVPTFYPENVDIKTVEWKSSDENIVRVDENGYVTGVNMGEANIIVTSLDGSEKTDTCKVTVGAIDPEAISFVGMPTEVYVGSYIENVTKMVKVTPEDADYTSLTITTSDKDILRYYNTDKILAKSIGTAQVIATLTLTDGSELSTSCDINVIADPAGVNTITADDVKAVVNGNLLTVEGLADDIPLMVASVQGSVVYHGIQHSCTIPSPGIYLVKVGGKTMKVIVK